MRRTIILALVCFLASCSANTEVYTSTFTQDYPNGRSIEVVREDRFTKWKGMLTGIDYGTSNNFSYSFTIEPEACEWKGRTNQAPLALVFCPNEGAYLKVTERIVKYDNLYSEPQFKDTTYYFRNVDDRYFFKLLGEQYFVDADSTTYHERRIKCGEFSVPYLQNGPALK